MGDGHRAGDAKVDELHRAVGRDQDIRGIDIAVHHVAFGVGVIEGPRDLDCDAERHTERETAVVSNGPLEKPPQVGAFDVFDHDVRALFEHSGAEDPGDVAVAECPSNPGFLGKHAQEVFVASQRWKDPLDHDLATGTFGRSGNEELRHAAAAKLVFADVVADDVARPELTHRTLRAAKVLGPSARPPPGSVAAWGPVG